MKNIVENQDIKTDKPLAMSYEALKAERDALAVENAALKQSELEFDKTCAEEFGPDWFSELTETPATDAALAAIQAQGVEMAAAALDALSKQFSSIATQANFRATAVYLRTEVLPAIREAK